MTIPLGLFCPINFPCGTKPEYPEKPTTFDRALTYSFHMRTGFVFADSQISRGAGGQRSKIDVFGCLVLQSTDVQWTSKV